MTHSPTLEWLVRETRRPWRMYAAVALLAGGLGASFFRWHSFGWYVMGGIQVVIALLIASIAWLSYRSSSALARVVRVGHTAPVQLTLSRRTQTDEDPEYFVRVEREGYSPDVRVSVSLAEWDESQPWGVPMAGTAYIDDADGEWMVIETPHGVVYR